MKIKSKMNICRTFLFLQQSFVTLSVLSPSLSSAAHKSEPFSVRMNNLGGEQQNVTQVGVNSTLSFGQAPFLRSLPFSVFELKYTPIVH